MKYNARHISGNLFQIDLIGESPEENFFIKNMNTDTAEYYFHTAVRSKLGTDACLLSIEDSKLFPFSVIGKVEFAKGL